MLLIKQIRSIQYRFWSNDQLKHVLSHLTKYSKVINVSGWKDGDKEGKKYQSYFKQGVEYHISNHPDDKTKGISSENDIRIDLMKELPENLHHQYDMVINHTVLEHIPDPVFAFNQIAKLSSDIVITVIPWKQVLHFIPGQFGDYFRISPFVMRDMYKKNGFEVIYEGYMPAYAPDTYLFYVGSKTPEKHKGFPKKFPPIDSLNGLVGKSSLKSSINGLFLRIVFAIYRLLKIV